MPGSENLTDYSFHLRLINFVKTLVNEDKKLKQKK